MRRFTCCALAAFCCRAFAAGDPALEELVVSATRVQASTNTASSVTVIDRAAIERSAAATVADLLRNRAGFVLTDAFSDGVQTQVAGRGFGGNAQANTLVVVDGRELNPLDLASPDLASVGLDDIERIELLGGSQAVHYGDEAAGGVIYLHTRDDEPTSVRIALGGGSFGERRADLAANLTAAGATARVHAARREADGFRDDASLDERRLFGTAAYRFDAGKLAFEVAAFDQQHGAPGPLTRAQRRFDPRRTSSFLETDARTRTARIYWQGDPDGAFRIEADAFVQAFDSDTPSTSPTFGNSLTEIERDTVALDPRAVLRLGAATVVAGFDIDRTRYSFANTSTLFGASGNEQRTDAIAGYLSVSLPVGDRLTLEAGARRGGFDTEADGFAAFGGIEADLDDDTSAAELGAHFQASPSIALTARVASSFRHPKADEQVSVFTGLNPLSTQEGLSYEVGLRHDGQRFSAVLDAFHLVLDDEIDFDPIAGFFGENLNLEETSRTGAIAQFTVTASEWLAGELDASWLRARLDGGNRVPFVARRTARAAMALTPHPRIDGRIELQYTGPRDAIGDFANAQRDSGGFTLVNATLRVRAGAFTIRLRAHNVFDRDYEEVASYAPFLGEVVVQPGAGARYLIDIEAAIRR